MLDIQKDSHHHHYQQHHLPFNHHQHHHRCHRPCHRHSHHQHHHGLSPFSQQHYHQQHHQHHHGRYQHKYPGRSHHHHNPGNMVNSNISITSHTSSRCFGLLLLQHHHDHHHHQHYHWKHLPSRKRNCIDFTEFHVWLYSLGHGTTAATGGKCFTTFPVKVLKRALAFMRTRHGSKTDSQSVPDSSRPTKAVSRCLAKPETTSSQHR